MSGLDHGMPLSPEQQACLRQHDAAVRPALALVLRLEGELDPERLERALARVLDAQPSLTHRVFRLPAYRGPRQGPGEPSWPLERQDWRDRPRGWAAFLADVEARRRAGFALDGERLGQAWLCRVEDACHGLAVSVADLIGDRGGLGAFAVALRRAYDEGSVEDAPHYGQYVEWRVEMARDDEAETGRAYWRQHLGAVADDPAARPRLPYRLERPAGPARWSLCEAEVTPDRADHLERLATELGVPLATLLQGAWWLLLGRVADQREMLVGWWHDCRRDYAAFADCVGPLEKSLPVRLELPAERSLADWLADLQGILEGHAAWQEHWAVEAPPLDDLSRAGFALETLPVDLGDWRLEARLGGEAPFELLLTGECRGERLTRLCLRVDERHYAPRVAELLLGQYRAFLSTLAGHGRTALADLPWTVDEAAWWQPFEGGPAANAGPWLPERIADWASRTPEALAVADAEVRLSYAQLDERVERLARRLRGRGVAPGQVVALVLPRSAAWVVALLAVWRAGGAWLPLDPAWPEARRRQLLAEAGARLALSERGIWPEGEAVALLHLDDPEAEEAPACRFESTTADRLAYVLFTSGSTGIPKSVPIDHRALLNYVSAASRALELGRCRHFAMTSTVAADLGHTTLFGALFSGAALHLASEEDIQDGTRFARFLRARAIDCLKIVPSHLAALLGPEADEPSASTVPDTVVLGGEAVPAGLVARLFGQAPACRLFNHYGPTEATVGVLYRRLEPGQDQGNGVALARAFEGCRVRLLDERLRPVPVGALGELCIGGAQLARAYRGGADANTESFLEDPLRPGERLYRSGDLGRLLPDGTLLLCGRRDHQVKVRGFRIEPAEVERALLAEPGVAQAVVRPWRPDEATEAQLIGYVEPTAEADPDWREALRAALARRLPAPLVPARLIPVARMPRLANGKIDRRGLPDPDTRAADGEYVAPRDAVETLLAEGMARLLGVERIGIHQDFFALGGHSLLVIKLVAGLRRQLQVDVHPGLVFDHPRVAALADALRAREAVPGALERLASARLKLNGLTAEQRDALLAKARAGADA